MGENEKTADKLFFFHPQTSLIQCIVKSPCFLLISSEIRSSLTSSLRPWNEPTLVRARFSFTMEACVACLWVFICFLLCPVFDWLIFCLFMSVMNELFSVRQILVHVITVYQSAELTIPEPGSERLPVMPLHMVKYRKWNCALHVANLHFTSLNLQNPITFHRGAFQTKWILYLPFGCFVDTVLMT